RASACERLLNDAIEQNLPATALADSLKSFGLKAVEASDYLDEYKQRVEVRRAKAKEPAFASREHTPVEGDPVRNQEERDKAVEEAAWASLRAKLESDSPSVSSAPSSTALEKVLEFFGSSQGSSASTSLSKSVLAVAPHLAVDDDTVFEDPYLKETQQYKTAYTNQKPFEHLIDKAQGRKIREPIANSIWKLVILDKYVDFEKLYATLDPSYNPNDEGRDLNDKFTLLEKNTVSSKRMVLTESEWMRLYDVWVDAVLHFYPHRKTELSSYRGLIVNMFRAAPSPLPAIRYDRDSRERYSRQPYRLDSSKDTLPLPLLSQLLAGAHGSASSPVSKKRSIITHEGPRKRSETICQNWNIGSCEGDPCRFGRRHHECCECGGPHRAKDKSECYGTLNRRRQQQ
ncbi:hypothetical protein BYT27DRAFT_7047359, partial [Phlegmacium glaucopus]